MGNCGKNKLEPKKSSSFQKLTSDSIYIHQNHIQKHRSQEQIQQKIDQFNQEYLLDIPQEDENINHQVNDIKSYQIVQQVKVSKIIPKHVQKISFVYNIDDPLVESNYSFSNKYDPEFLKKLIYQTQDFLTRNQSNYRYKLFTNLQKSLNKIGVTLIDYEELHPQEKIHSLSKQLVMSTYSPCSKKYLKFRINQNEQQDEALKNVFQLIKSQIQLHFQKQVNVQILDAQVQNNSIMLDVFISNLQNKEILNLCDFLQQYYNVKAENSHIFFEIKELDIWGDRQYKQVNHDQLIKGQFPYYQPNNFWIRYGLKVLGQYSNDLWIQSDQIDLQWPVAFLPIATFNTQTQQYQDYQQHIAKLKSINTKFLKNYFIECNQGYILYANPNQFTKQKLSFIYKNTYKNQTNFTFKNETIIQDNGQQLCLLLQCRVNPNQLLIPVGFSNQIYLVKNLDDIRPYGILVGNLNIQVQSMIF